MTEGFFEFVKPGGVDTLIPLSLGGEIQQDGTIATASSWQVVRGSVAPPPDIDPTGTMTLGLGGGVGTVALIDASVAALHSEGAYQYWTSTADYDWANICAHYPSDWQFFIAASPNTLTQARNMLATFPATRTGKVRISFGQEKDNDSPYRTGTYPNYVYRGDLYISDSAPLRQAIAEAIAAGKTYLEPSVSLMPQTIYQPLVADTFIASDVKHLMVSMYAQAKDKGTGHMVATRDAVKMPKRIGDYAITRGLDWDAAAWGFFLGNAYLADPTSIQNRVDWMVTSAREARKNGAHFCGWFNTPWTVAGAAGDYRVQTDSALLAAWNGLLAEFGQYP
ncbi:hypothetical protein ACPPVT_07445 [Angustibacter sp. McL0619]|uniref:hypothetical protein n=1 Tax=Angustibacter sp. McL0619 TaxID=3415676 RepID=UPI003CEF79A4